MQRMLLSLALIATAGVTYAQTVQTTEPRDSYDRPVVGRNDYVRQAGDQPGPMGASNSAVANGNVATAIPYAHVGYGYGKMTTPPLPAGPREATFKDEYGFSYDAQGNRVDARSNVISPQTPQR